MTIRIFKKTVLLLALFVTASIGNSQATKIGYLNYGSVIFDLPEYKKMNDSLMNYYLEMQEVLKDIEEKYLRKQAEIDKLIKEGKNPRIIELEQYQLQQYQQMYQLEQRDMEEKVAKKEQELLDPLKKKVDAAIEAVSKEKGFTMVLDASTILYKRDMDDIENLVRANLKLITKEESEKKRKESVENTTPTATPQGPMGPLGGN